MSDFEFTGFWNLSAFIWGAVTVLFAAVLVTGWLGVKHVDRPKKRNGVKNG